LLDARYAEKRPLGVGGLFSFIGILLKQHVVVNFMLQNGLTML
jgi:hypothetical protein